MTGGGYISRPVNSCDICSTPLITQPSRARGRCLQCHTAKKTGTLDPPSSPVQPRTPVVADWDIDRAETR